MLGFFISSGSETERQMPGNIIWTIYYRRQLPRLYEGGTNDALLHGMRDFSQTPYSPRAGDLSTTFPVSSNTQRSEHFCVSQRVTA